MEPAGATCPRCGAAVERDQLLCLECGERLAIAYRRHPSWRLPASIVAGVVLLAGAGGGVALSEVSDDADELTAPPAPGQPAPPAAPGAAPPAESPPPPAGEAEPPAGEAVPPPPAGEAAPPPEQPPAGGELESWSQGESAYTVVLVSAQSRSGAETRAREAVEAGIPAGVLRSDDYPSLNPGYWVVFAGQLDSREEAQSRAEEYAAKGFPGGYARFVEAGG